MDSLIHYDSHKKHILIVDDDITQLSILKDILSDEGFQVMTVATGQHAIDNFKKTCFSVVVIDLQLPDLNGTELLAQLLELDHRVRVIIYTGYGCNTKKLQNK